VSSRSRIDVLWAPAGKWDGQEMREERPHADRVKLHVCLVECGSSMCAKTESCGHRPGFMAHEARAMICVCALV